MSTVNCQTESGCERRRKMRFRASWPIEFFQFGTKNTPGQAAVAIDLSQDDLCLKTDKPLKTGMNLFIRIQEINRTPKYKEEACFARNLSVSEVKWCQKVNSEKRIWYHVGIKHVLSEYP